MSFSRQLKWGQIGESRLAQWFKRKGWSVLPVYETELNSNKGPRLFLPNNKYLIAPDMLIFKSKECYWVEAKHKTAFAWHRISQQWTTGIDLKHYFDYLQVEDYSPFPIWLVFLHEGGKAKDSPPNSPKGIFGNPLSFLRNHESHRHSNWGNSGMVYWSIKSLKKLD